MATLLQILCASVEIGLYLALVAATVHLALGVVWRLRRGDVSLEPAPALPAQPPLLTVQLPIYNEAPVVEALLRTTALLDWPRDRLEIQVLDDSTDETVGIIDRVVAELSATGVPISTLRRGDRAGYKAGNLAFGLAKAQGELLLLLDADFLPRPDLARRLLPPLLADSQLAFTQARWTYRNADRSLITNLQAAILDALFVIEQARGSDASAPVQFNGTAGLWRKSAIERAGGWLVHDDALTEDLELSFRTHELGLRGRTLPDVAVSTELPADMGSFVEQQSRWVRGAALGLRTLGRRLISRASQKDARTMLAHLARHARQPLFFLALLRLPVLAWGWAVPVAPSFVGPTVIVIAIAIAAAYLTAARWWIGVLPHTLWRTTALGPALAALSVGIAPSLTATFVGGLLGHRGRGFLRTPKGGASAERPPRISLLALFTFVAAFAAMIRFGEDGDAIGVFTSALVSASLGWVSLPPLFARAISFGRRLRRAVALRSR